MMMNYFGKVLCFFFPFCEEEEEEEEEEDNNFEKSAA